MCDMIGTNYILFSFIFMGTTQVINGILIFIKL